MIDKRFEAKFTEMNKDVAAGATPSPATAEDATKATKKNQDKTKGATPSKDEEQ
jgi:hypothetical protein